MTPSGIYWLFSLQVFPQRGIKEAVPNTFSSVNAPSIQLGNHIHLNTVRIHQDLYFNYTSWKIIQHSSFPNLDRYTLHQAVNAASRIQYRVAVSLKESSSQPFTYTSLL
ncbi:hypothetical protein O181_045493 [Austropuccinia psidii MF-1]|uniref:Uncharacterized protein n=1 Tax=Austropuccinia psidii MF-1 TaxID=1389203 RepID=A0A9Q3HHN2_9BASI|nr:hypothetical protein [Austropuccinia psidii MF-1]